MTIYTGRGDEGQTDLRNMDRVSKASPRIEAYGTVDELNAVVGTLDPAATDIEAHLLTIQEHLHILQAELADPAPDEDSPRLTDAHVETLETWMDNYEDELEPLQSFVLPGGSELGAALHHARAVCGRAERRVVVLASEADVDVAIPLTYLNRLSDALFRMARVVNTRAGEPEPTPSY